MHACRAMSPSGFRFLPVSLLHLDLSHMVGHHTPLMTHLGRLKRLQHLDLTGNETMNTGTAPPHPSQLQACFTALLNGICIIFFRAPAA